MLSLARRTRERVGFFGGAQREARGTPRPPLGAEYTRTNKRIKKYDQINELREIEQNIVASMLCDLTADPGFGVVYLLITSA